MLAVPASVQRFALVVTRLSARPSEAVEAVDHASTDRARVAGVPSEPDGRRSSRRPSATAASAWIGVVIVVRVDRVLRQPWSIRVVDWPLRTRSCPVAY